MCELTYDGKIADWKIKLAIRRAKRMGFRGHDLEDVMQVLALELVRFVYSPDRANGLSEKRALSGLIDRRLIDMVRKNRRNAQMVADQDIEDKLNLKRAVRDDLRNTLKEAVSKLDSTERAIYDRMAAGQSIAEIAEDHGCGWHTIMRRVENIRMTFRDCGLEKWL